MEVDTWKYAWRDGRATDASFAQTRHRSPGFYKDQRTVRRLHPAVNRRLTRLVPRHDLDTVNINVS